ncbi:hypothetical protein EG68_01709 [Paragonimus skrjabini miyazakii]|uniref:6-phosphogluconolactonase n=1 Tax=Paragonimus skrjabini miyazakii TaxID=59628 RepID=A0A8S9Z0I4_9TREM|nr:hypothetical protein EG68_01709 [Paragonimus skrjabini miyazakii]
MGLSHVIFDNEHQLAVAVTKTIADCMQDALTGQQTFSVGLCGGSMAKLISPHLRQLADINWSRVHFFYCDERIVPPDSPEYTHKLYQEELYSYIDIPSENVHAVNTFLTVDIAAKNYQEDLLKYFGASDGYPCFDLLLLGIGPDGHTCSLFPQHEILKCEDAVVAPISDSPKPPPERVTLTVPVLNKAKRIYFLVCGSNKAEIVAKIFDSSSQTTQLPCTLVQPIDGELVWYLDKSAASHL